MAIVTASTLSLLAAAALAADRPPGKSEYRERYGVLAEHNIFLKDRSRPTTARSTSGTPTTRETPKAAVPELSFVLTGIVQEEGQYRAYVEDVPNAKILRLNVGDAVAAGKIAAIEIDAISYESAGQQTRVDVGRDLTGAPFNSFAAGATTTTGATPTSGPAATPAAPGGVASPVNTANLSIEERMRLRRAQELNRK